MASFLLLKLDGCIDQRARLLFNRGAILILLIQSKNSLYFKQYLFRIFASYVSLVMCVCVCVCVCACACALNHVQLFATPWIIAGQTSLSMEFSRQESGSGLSFPPPWDLPEPGIEPTSFGSAGGFFYHWVPWEALFPWLIHHEKV